MTKEKNVNESVYENVTRHDVPRHCEERSDEAIHSIDCRVGLRPPRNDENRNGNPPTLTLPLRWGGNIDENSGTLQSLLNVKDLARASRGRALSSKMTKSLQTTSADPFNASEQEFTYLPIHLFSRKCKAFTLAEVLVTLAVIGIVAVMTIPTLVQNYQEKATIAKVKKFYSTFSQAYKLAVVENGTLNEWDLSGYEENNDENSKYTVSDKTIESVDKFMNNISKYMNGTYVPIRSLRTEDGSKTEGACS